MISPCVRICTMDPDSGLCEGCGRTIEEIAGWIRLDETARQAIMDTLPARLAAKRAAEAKSDAAAIRPLRERVWPRGWRSR